MIVNVTANDIAKGERYLPEKCPIARALKRVTKAKKVSIGPWYFYIMKDGEDYERYQMTDEMEEFVKKFDSGIPVRPVKFKIELKEMEQ